MEGAPSCSKHGDCRECQREMRKAAKEAAKEARNARPKRPGSPYLFFVRHVRNRVQQENPGLKFSDITHLVASQWNDLGKKEKKQYEAMAANDRERYANEMIVYNNNTRPPQVVERAHVIQPPVEIPREEGEDTECVVCLDNERAYAIVPCGHLCVCGGCVGRVKECPICRGRIQSILKIYF
jgi:hypothetical protein